ncbi:MAG: membrane peptidase [Ignavibacteria bacterium]|nr:MAG: membrane peptidase [Ignavibacteria bacterium]KAF0161204.1 MAG: membrane peptidase [Ignavibacteria bacterium]
MKWFDFDSIKNSSLNFTPNLPILATKRYKVSLIKAAAYILLYTLASWFVLVLLLSITPLKDVLFVVDNSELKAQNERIQKLQGRVVDLTQQLQEISSVNERMKYAVKLAQRDTIEPKNPLYDTLRTTITKKIKIEGSVFNVVVDLFQKLFQNEREKNRLLFFEPASGVIIQEFNPAKGHLGIDYGISKGSPVFAASGGLIIFADYTVDSGYMIIIQHSDDYTSVYKHCSTLLKKVRDSVTHGELIALSGNSGKNTTGPHLHFEVWYQGKPVNPKSLIIK